MARESAEDIVRLIAGLLHYRHTHGFEQLLEHGQLLRELVGHTLSCRLIAAVHLVAKCRLLYIECHRHRLGSALILEAQEDIHKAVNGVGESAVLRREHLYAVKRAVQYAVSVDNKKIHVSLRASNLRYYIIPHKLRFAYFFMPFFPLYRRTEARSNRTRGRLSPRACRALCCPSRNRRLWRGRDLLCRISPPGEAARRTREYS